MGCRGTPRWFVPRSRAVPQPGSRGGVGDSLGHATGAANLLTVLTSLQHALQVPERPGLLRLRNRLFVILKHLVDIRLHINPIPVPWERLQGVEAVLKKSKTGSSGTQRAVVSSSGRYWKLLRPNTSPFPCISLPGNSPQTRGAKPVPCSAPMEQPQPGLAQTPDAFREEGSCLQPLRIALPHVEFIEKMGKTMHFLNYTGPGDPPTPRAAVWAPGTGAVGAAARDRHDSKPPRRPPTPRLKPALLQVTASEDPFARRSPQLKSEPPPRGHTAPRVGHEGSPVPPTPQTTC